MRHVLLSLLIILFLVPGATAHRRVQAPQPYGPVPSERQLAWHDIQFYAFICLSSATYRDVEWGYGDMDPDEFQPVNFNPRQWVEVVKASGMKGLVLTAKHHDGFCLWPSKLTDYSVANSSWRDGKGDIVGELAREARRAGLHFGVYLSPWDRHDLRYGSTDYIDYYRGQLKELLTWYGPIFEVWKDGANGGDGYYGGRREQRKVDGRTYYDWPRTDSLIHQLQPKACIFSDGGPDIRWCGNESGFVGETNWAILDVENYAPGVADANGLRHGNPQGSAWVPAEVDVSIRPGWFYHASEDDKVKTLEHLMKIYYESVGRGSNLILNAPPTKEGLIHPIDSMRLVEFGRALRREFSRPLRKADIASVVASNQRGGSRRFGPGHVLDGRKGTYWATDDSVRRASITIQLRHPQPLYSLRMREPIQLGQRINHFSVEVLSPLGEWKTVAQGTTIGPQRLLRLENVQAEAVRLTIESPFACPLLREVQFYLIPE
ncbi:MAG: alpha-L-fucosidase [Bacteroidaceae bacterium]|nr:alpha-L-fucosidase [Bacteroidaceae bacterium]